MPLETYTGGGVMCQHDVHAARAREPFNLVGRVVTLGRNLGACQSTLVVRRTIATADATNSNGVPSSVSDIEPCARSAIDQAGKHFRSCRASSHTKSSWLP